MVCRRLGLQLSVGIFVFCVLLLLLCGRIQPANRQFDRLLMGDLPRGATAPHCATAVAQAARTWAAATLSCQRNGRYPGATRASMRSAVEMALQAAGPYRSGQRSLGRAPNTQEKTNRETLWMTALQSVRDELAPPKSLIVLGGSLPVWRLPATSYLCPLVVTI